MDDRAIESTGGVCRFLTLRPMTTVEYACVPEVVKGDILLFAGPKVVGRSTKTAYFHDWLNVVAEYNGSSQLQRTYVTPGLDANLTMTASGSTYYYLTDALGSIRQLIDSNEATQNSYDYYAFGKVYGTPTENLTQPFRFTGRAWDDESELYYYRARSYTAAHGRFLGRDARGREGAQSLYVYARNLPLLYTDPLGLAPGCNSPDDKGKKRNCRFAGLSFVKGQLKPSQDVIVDKVADNIATFQEVAGALNLVGTGASVLTAKNAADAVLDVVDWGVGAAMPSPDAPFFVSTWKELLGRRYGYRVFIHLKWEQCSCKQKTGKYWWRPDEHYEEVPPPQTFGGFNCYEQNGKAQSRHVDGKDVKDRMDQVLRKHFKECDNINQL